MRTLQLLISFLFLFLSGYSQLSKLKGSWINSKQEYVVINDTTSNNNILCGAERLDNNLYLSIYSDTLSFQERYTSSTDNYRERRIKKYDFKILKLSDSTLIVKVISQILKDFLNSTDTIKFTRQQYAVDSSIRFEKLIFHTTTCLGNCPVLNIQIDSNRQMLYNGFFVINRLTRNNVDTSVDGNFKGTLNNQDYEKLLLLLKTCNLTTLKFRPQFCCDAPIVTLIVYFNGQRKHIKSMFLPAVLNDLISFLYIINKKAQLERIPNNIQLEE